MRVHKVKDCCCGCTLETGTKIIAWLQIVCGIIATLNFIATVALLDHVNQSTDEITKNLFADLAKIDQSYGDTGRTSSIGNFGNFGNITFPFTINQKDGTVNVPRPTASMFIGYIVCGVLVTILGLILLIGASNRRPHLLRIWIVVSLIVLVLYIISAVVQVILVVLIGLYLAVLYILISLLVGLLINYYCIMVVSSFRKQIMSENNPV